jgi:hypothetical protein
MLKRAEELNYATIPLIPPPLPSPPNDLSSSQVTVEKFQGPCAAKSNPPTDTCGQEKLIIDALRRVKEVDNSVCTIFYYNSILNFPQYDLSARFMERNASLLLHDHGGKLITESGGGKSGLTVFDFQQQAACDLWASECVNATATGFVDGCFADRAIDVQGFETNGQITAAQRAAFDKGHWDMLARLQTTIGAGPVIANHAYNLTGVGAAMIEFGKADAATVEDIRESAANGKVTQAHFKAINDDTMATFLVAAGPNSFIGAGGWSFSGDAIRNVANRWLPQYYERALGEPLSDAVESVTGDGANRTFTRRFGKGTNVTLTCPGANADGGCTGTIDWADAPPTPPTPPTPVPPPPPQPTGSCPVVQTQCSWQHADIAQKAAGHWAECCALCRSTGGCTKWVFRTAAETGLDADDGGGGVGVGSRAASTTTGNCRLHGASATSGGGDANVCGTIATSSGG